MATINEIKKFLELKNKKIECELKNNVFKIFWDGKNSIVKFDKKGIFKQAFNENLIYEKYGDLEGLPKKIGFYRGISKSGNGIFSDYILEKEFIDGKKYFGQEIPKKEKNKFIELVDFFYNEGYEWLNLNYRNLILSNEFKLYLIDFGTLNKNLFPPKNYQINFEREFLKKHFDYEFKK